MVIVGVYARLRVVCMGKHKKWIQVIILLAVLLIGGFSVGSSLFSKETIPKEGSAAPHFTLTGLDGKTHSLSDYRGRAVMINFWGSWCDPCTREMPAIQSQYEKWKDKGFVVLGLNLDESPVTVENFVRQYKLTFPILFDVDLRMRNRYGVISYPTSFFLDPNGKIVKIHPGEMNEQTIEEAIRQTLD